MLGLTSQASFANNEKLESANNLVNEMMIKIESILAQDISDQNTRKVMVSELFDQYFDLPTIAKFSAGPYWRSADPIQRDTYQTIIRDVIISTVVRNFDQLSGLKFTATSSQAKGEKLVLVTGTFTDINKQQAPIAVGWRVLMHEASPPLILDVEIENISMLVTQKQENIAIIRKNGGKFVALIEAMQQRNKTND